MDKQLPEGYSTLELDTQQDIVLRDREGLVWNTDISTIPVYQGNETNWEATLTIKCTANAQELADSRTLDPEDDERLLGLIGSKTIHFTTTPRKFHGRSEDHVKRLAHIAKAQFQKEIENPKHLEKKRVVINTWVDRWHQFG